MTEFGGHIIMVQVRKIRYLMKLRKNLVFQFYESEKYRSETDMVFDCLNGTTINE